MKSAAAVFGRGSIPARSMARPNGREMSRTPACCGQAAELSSRNQVGRSRRKRCRLHRGFEPLRGEDPRWFSSRPLCEGQRRKVGCRALLGFVVTFQSYYYFPSGVSFCQIPDSLRDLTQPVTPVDDRCYLFGLNELFQENQILLVYLRYPH
jgi:hypothetical protein